MFSDYIKPIQDWCKLKIALWSKKSAVVFKQGDIWWCSLGFNIGEEILGKGEKFTRPVLVFKKFTSDSFLGLPLTTHGKKGSWYVEIMFNDTKQYVLLNQARILDKKRLTNRIGALGNTECLKVKKKFLEFYGS